MLADLGTISRARLSPSPRFYRSAVAWGVPRGNSSAQGRDLSPSRTDISMTQQVLRTQKSSICLNLKLPAMTSLLLMPTKSRVQRSSRQETWGAESRHRFFLATQNEQWRGCEETCGKQRSSWLRVSNMGLHPEAIEAIHRERDSLWSSKAHNAGEVRSVLTLRMQNTSEKTEARRLTRNFTR